MELYNQNTITETNDAIYVIGSYLPFERTNPYNSKTQKSYAGELMLLGYNEDYEIFKSIKIYKINKSIVDDDILNNKLKNISNSNLKDSFLASMLVDNVFSNIKSTDSGDISDDTKYINKFSVVLDGKMFAFYDMYSDNLEKIMELAEILRDELVINIKAQIALKQAMEISENRLRNLFTNLIMFRWEEILLSEKRIRSRKKYISELSKGGDLKLFRDRYLNEYNEHIMDDDMEIDIDVIEGKFKPVSVLTNFSLRELKKVYISYFDGREDSDIELTVDKVAFKYKEKNNLSVPTIHGTYNPKDGFGSAVLSIDFNYLMGVNEQGHYVFHDSVVMTKKEDDAQSKDEEQKSLEYHPETKKTAD